MGILFDIYTTDQSLYNPNYIIGDTLTYPPNGHYPYGTQESIKIRISFHFTASLITF
jgi:hypothetical protein